MSDVVISAKNLSKRYGDFRALTNATFEVKKGEILGFLGPNGAGKSTTMKILTCFIAPSDGSATINGCDIWTDPIGVRKAIGYLPESTPLYIDMLVAEYLEFMGEMRGLRGADLKKRVRAVVDETALGSVFGKEIRTLSKGYKQRVGLAQSLIHEPPILILDEPMSGLDPNQAEEVRDLIRQIGKERTVILSTHNLAEVQVTCQRVLIISGGKIVADDTPQALTAKKSTSYVVSVEGAGNAKSVFAAIPGVDRVIEKSNGPEAIFELIASTNKDLRGDVFRAAVEGKLTLLELRTEGQNLEQVFRELTLSAVAKSESRSEKEARAEKKAEAKPKDDEPKNESKDEPSAEA